MVRPKVGPRRLNSKSLVWYVQIRDPATGKRYSRSLETTNHQLAWERYPEVLADLQRSLPSAPIGRESLITEPIYDQDGHVIGERTGLAGDLIPDLVPDPIPEPELSWERAIQIGYKRRHQKTGKKPSDEWEKGIRLAIKDFKGTDPLTLTLEQIRAAADRMEARGNKPQTISLRMGSIAALINSLIKTANTPEDYRNPFDRLDFSTSVGESYRTPTPDEYAVMWKRMLEKRVDIQVAFKLTLYTGARIMEVLSRERCHFNEDNMTMVIGETVTGWRPKNNASYRTLPLPEWLFKEAMDSVGIGSWPCDMKAVRRIAKYAANDLTIHSLRHGWRTAARQAGSDPYSAELYMGHAAGSAMDRRYGVVPLEALLRAAEPTWRVLDQWTGRG